MFLFIQLEGTITGVIIPPSGGPSSSAPPSESTAPIIKLPKRIVANNNIYHTPGIICPVVA
jgi:hypothetical protein